MTRMAIAFDLDKCLGCHACVVACKQQNRLPSGLSRNQILRVGPSTVTSSDAPPSLEMYFLPALCQHCENPRCVQVCPVGAASQREDGVVLIDKSICIGCRFCVTACPYGQCYYNNEDIEKCTLCVNSIDKGEKPACVKVCMGKCISFGDLDDPDSEISKVIRETGENVRTFIDSGNKPVVRYILHQNKTALRGF